MELVPFVLLTFKVLVLGIGMFVAIKWHYDQEKKVKSTALRVVLLTSAKVAAFFVLAALGLVFATFALGGWLGLDLTSF